MISTEHLWACLRLFCRNIDRKFLNENWKNDHWTTVYESTKVTKNRGECTAVGHARRSSATKLPLSPVTVTVLWLAM